MEKSAHPIPPSPEERKLKLLDYPWFTTRYLAEIIVLQYPHLSQSSQQRLVQISAQELRNHDFRKFPISHYDAQTFEPKMSSGTPFYSLKEAIAILENMNYEVEVTP